MDRLRMISADLSAALGSAKAGSFSEVFCGWDCASKPMSLAMSSSVMRWRSRRRTVSWVLGRIVLSVITRAAHAVQVAWLSLASTRRERDILRAGLTASWMSSYPSGSGLPSSPGTGLSCSRSCSIRLSANSICFSMSSWRSSTWMMEPSRCMMSIWSPVLTIQIASQKRMVRRRAAMVDLVMSPTKAQNA